jgi:glycosyltransferase involved in cell wall biosynthesis
VGEVDRDQHPSGRMPLLSVIVPVYNEKDNIIKIITAVKNVAIDKEIILVDDKSGDGTPEILKKIKDCKLILHEKNQGKGAAIRHGLAQASGKIVIIQDADLEYSPVEFPRLVRPIDDGKTKVVYGSRILGQGTFLRSSFLANKLLTLLTNIIFNGRLTDMETCYKVIDRKLMLELSLISSRFEIEPEITCKLLKKRVRITELPISYQGRRKGKKIGPMDGLQAIWNILKWKIKN